MMAVQKLEKEISELKKVLLEKENELKALKENVANQDTKIQTLDNDDIARYSRQIIMSEVGMKGQLKLKQSSILIIGAGGLGCPCAQYLAGAGIGHIGILDYDIVEINNLHRQLLHGENSIGISKVESAKSALLSLNSKMKISTHHVQLDSTNALKIVGKYDIVIDCSDNVATRYLMNDVCVLLKKSLISGSALQLEGQLTVYNHNSGPCYRCIFPTPPPPEAVTNCGDGGVIGAVTGVIGALQALETIKILLNQPGVLSGRLLLFDGSASTFRTVRLRNKKENCDVCSSNPKLTELIDYEQFCNMKATDKDSHLSILEADERISVQDLKQLLESDKKQLLIDVRSPNEFEICRLDKSINIPIKRLLNNECNTEILEEVKQHSEISVLAICRRGNDSQLAVKHLVKLLEEHHIKPKDIIGGLHQWHYSIDKTFPIY